MTPSTKRELCSPAAGLVLALVVVGIAAILASLSVGYHFARKFYVERAELQLNPINLEYFRLANESLGSPKRRRVVFFGDSRVEGWSPRPDVPATEFVWRGIGGESTGQMLYRTKQDVINLDPAVVVIQAGINDLVAAASIDRESEAVRQVVENLARIAAACAESGAEVRLLTVIRPSRPSLLRRLVWSDSIRDRVREVNAGLLSLRIPRVKVIDADRSLATNDGEMPAQFAADTLHLTPAGYRVLNGLLLDSLQTPHVVQQ